LLCYSSKECNQQLPTHFSDLKSDPAFGPPTAPRALEGVGADPCDGLITTLTNQLHHYGDEMKRMDVLGKDLDHAPLSRKRAFVDLAKNLSGMGHGMLDTMQAISANFTVS
jgi:hypothetical protein